MTGHLIHIGYAKAGSTYLRRWFAAHPQLAYVEGGIAGFGNVHQLATPARAATPDPRYRVTSCEGFASPHSYGSDASETSPDPGAGARYRSGQAEICGRLAGLFPNARILFVTRGFRAMILSSYSQYVRTGGAAALEEMVAGADQAWNYDHVVDLYGRAFGAANVIAMPYELLRDDAGGFLKVLERILGLDEFPFSNPQVNRSLSEVEMAWYPRFSRALRTLPVGEALRGRLLRLQARGAFNNRFRLPIRILQRLRPAAPVTEISVPEALLEQYRGKADGLGGNPLYAPYADDYLF